ncbi:MAG: T9SS type A sorting domain-containing protein [Bacteroidales bacterium]
MMKKFCVHPEKPSVHTFVSYLPFGWRIFMLEVRRQETGDISRKTITLNIQIYPNPTNGVSSFGFRVPGIEHVTLKIYDIHGRQVANVLDEKLPAGEHVVRYDMSGLPAGVYVVGLRAKGI